ncbi:serine hydrolase [Rossellomorea arthrocnemi]|uniref:serine hydrolase n=1 Tax=Rossellomorea arthrocnemi TaxID=2769542 RepID=UPI00191B8392|nr:serine hydrolase [Rossellomorea arthrocnemi]
MKHEQMETFRGSIISLIPPNTKFGFYLHDTETMETVTINEEKWFPLASIAKWVTAILVSRNGHPVVKEDVYSAICEHNHKSYLNLLQEHPDLSINVLLEEMGIDCKVSSQNRDIVNNTGTPKGLFKMMDMLLHEGLNREYRTNIIEGMKNQVDPDGFRFSIPWFHMTGGLEGVCNDVGFIEKEGKQIIVIGLLYCQDPSVEWTDLEKVMNKIGVAIMDQLG